MSSLLAADSFRVRVRDGRAEVRGLETHLWRFISSVGETRKKVSGLETFVDESLERIAEYGEGHPRLEFRPDRTLHLLLRPLPMLRETIELRTTEYVELAHPERKGPNIERFAELNRTLGAETLLLDADGAVSEGTTTAILWWDENTLCRSASRGRVASVTEALLLVAAKASGIRTESRRTPPSELAAHEVWAVNALHGIRPVTRIDDTVMPMVDETRRDAFARALDGSWEPVLPERLQRRRDRGPGKYRPRKDSRLV